MELLKRMCDVAGDVTLLSRRTRRYSSVRHHQSGMRKCTPCQNREIVAHVFLSSLPLSMQASFANIDSWYGSIDNANPSSEVAILVVGNKLDLESQRKVSFDDGRSLARRLKGQFVETSAKDSANVDIAFMQLAKALVARQRQSDDRSRSANISLNKSTGGNSTKCCN